MEAEELYGKTAGELSELMRDKLQALVEGNHNEISVREACDLITEAILVGSIILGSVTEEPISIVLGKMAGIALESELQSAADEMQRQADELFGSAGFDLQT